MTRMSDHRLKVWAFVVTLALYLAVGYWLQVRHGFILGDALSRVSAAQSVLFSRDPHLAAIGFIFTPLTAMMQIPAIALSPVWPDLADTGLRGFDHVRGFHGRMRRADHRPSVPTAGCRAVTSSPSPRCSL